MTYRDMITIKRDVRSSGSELPDHSEILAEKIPCKIQQVAGDETWRGRQLNEHIDYVIELWHSLSLNAIKPTDQVEVTGGWMTGRTLNIRWPRFYDQRNGMPPMLELFCREGTV